MNSKEPDDLSQAINQMEDEVKAQWQAGVENITSSVNGEKVLRVLDQRRRRRRIATLVALFVVSISAWFIIKPFQSSKLDQSLEASITWLKREQLQNGSWDAAKWGGKERFTVGVSSLALMSILQVEDNNNSVKVLRSLDYLMDQQQDSGLFGPEFLGDLYNHCLATLALKKAQSLGYQIDVKIIDKAETYLEEFKTREGHWAYRKGMQPERNLSEWATLAMKGSKDFYLNWSSSQKSQSKTFIEQRVATNKVDAMDVFFDQMLGEVQSAVSSSIIKQQEQEGQLAGSWPIQGKWSHVGGRVFTTGMAVLCLKPLTI